MKAFLLLIVVLLTACGTSGNSGAATASAEVPTAAATLTYVPTARPTARPTITVAPRPTLLPNVTAVPLLDSITLMYIEKGWNTISPMLADPALQEIGEASADRPFEQNIPFKVEGITLVAFTRFTGNNLSDGGMICVLYSRSDRTQWVIPVAVAQERQSAPGTFAILANVQDPRNVIARTALPSSLKVVVYR